MTKQNILVLCTGNSCRSQMMHGYLNRLAGDKLSVYSAGVATHGINPYAVKVMAEDGIDISGHTSNHVEEYRGIDFKYMITVCDHARETCPWFPGNAERIHHSFEDPSDATGTDEEKLIAYRKTRDEIKAYVQQFIAERL